MRSRPTHHRLAWSDALDAEASIQAQRVVQAAPNARKARSSRDVSMA
ncbi:hypothetical protein [Cyanobium sp. CH-040]|nr:hypothetical protein [Cyanobium sp. CH-040]MCP9927231.1 hypothetical protein [Cyanobium sp. CH-040]